MTAARQLTTRMVEKVWGREVLPAGFAGPSGKRIGELWFEPPPELPEILVKYLFTSEKLSVQVHPPDALALSGEAGKEECWLVIDAAPDARLAIGFENNLEIDAIRSAALDGSIEDLLRWHPARAGDLFYLPAGTVHAIGAGLTLVEIQQNSDTTFRLYDYGRPRELHLERALAVLSPSPYEDQYRSTAGTRGQALVDGPHFRLHRIEGAPDDDTLTAFAGPVMALPLDGEITDQAGVVRAAPGECLLALALGGLDFRAAGTTLVVSSPLMSDR